MSGSWSGDLLVRAVEVEGAPCDVRLSGGRVVEIAPSIRRRAGERVIEGTGGALMPGLHDHHIHLMALSAAERSHLVGPPAVTDPLGFDHRIRALDREHPAGEWLRVIGLEEGSVGRVSRERLDALAPGRPVRVQHRSGRLWVLSSAAIELLGAGTGPETLPRAFERDAFGRVTGRVVDGDEWLRGRTPTVDPDVMGTARRLSRFGITGVTDLTPEITRRDLDHFARALDDGMPLRVTVTGGVDVGTDHERAMRVGPVKLVLEESRSPHFDDVCELIATAHHAERPVAIHTVSRSTLVLAIGALRTVGPVRGDRLEHAAIVPSSLVGDLASLGLAVVTQPNFIAERGDAYLRDLDARDVCDLYRCASLRRAGVTVAFGTDAPFGDPDPWRAIDAAVSRRSPTGVSIGPDERVPAKDALEMFLADPDSLGSTRRVAVGAPADLCLLDAPLVTALRSPSPDRVVATIFDGRVVYDREDGERVN
jgi:predicted amidohydrolase YtcJ